MGFTARLLVVLALLVGAAAARADGTAEALIAQNGGVYRDGKLAAYVQAVGLKLAAAAGQRGGWRFTVLDTPDANAFALPGRRIFVTRGMLALVGDEAELAAVLGHEVGHAVAGDGTVPLDDRGRRAAEFAADHRGMRYLEAAGYDPGAQVDVLGTLLASRSLEVELRRGDPGLAPTMEAADHPALADRLTAARQEATGKAGKGARGKGAYLAAIDGMVWGDGPAQGFVRGRSFVHPELRFAFDAPPGYALANRPDAVVATGPRGATLLLDSLPDPGGTQEAYLLRGWVPEIGRDVRVVRVEGPRRTTIGGLPAAQARVTLASGASTRTADLTVVRHRGRFYRLSGLHETGDGAGAAALAASAASFRPLSAAEAARIRPLRIRIHRIGRGDHVAALAAGMPVGAASRARFDLLNGLRRGTPGLRVGDEDKLVGE